MIDKNRIKVKLEKYPLVARVSRYIYTWLNCKGRLYKKKYYGPLHSDKIIYIIRPNSEDGIQGLMSLFIQAMRKVGYAREKGYIPVIDYKNYHVQYSDGINNAWEFYFKQPSLITLEEAYRSSNVILSGVSLKRTEAYELFKDTIFTNSMLCQRCHELIMNNIIFSEETTKILENELLRLNIKDCIGVYLRGTDYIKLRPIGEHIQPTIDMVIEKTNEFMTKYPKCVIFLVTEEERYYLEFKDRYGDKVKIVSFDSFVRDYDGKDFISKSNVLDSDVKKRGMHYLVKMILLSKCRCFIGSITMGSIVSYAMNGNLYEDSYVFDLGLYD